MADKSSSDQGDKPTARPQPSWIARSIRKAKRDRHQRRTEKYHENAADRASRSTARATWMIAVLTIATIGVGISQYIVFSRQLDEMKATREGGDKSFSDQIAVMQGQLNQMNLAQRPWIKLESIQPTSLSSDDAYGVSFWAKVIVSNVGHSPAQNVSVTADLLIQNFDPSPDEGMKAACQKGSSDPWIIPGRPIFPGQIQGIDGDVPNSWLIDISRIREARLARIRNIYSNRAARGDTESARAWADESAKFPFFAPIAFVGCINYRSPDNREVYQTSFMFNLGTNNGSTPFPLLSGKMPVIQPPTPSPSDPDVLVVHRVEPQRILRDDQIKLTVPLFATFAN